MANADSDSGDITKEELVEITTCCMCTDVYTDPKVLPCIHTLCMKCLQMTGLKTNKEPGDEMPCPICRRQFKIPLEGFHGLPTKIFIERLIQTTSVSDQGSPSGVTCTLCLEEGKEEVDTENSIADTYCVDCKHKLCEECCNEHRNCKATQDHKMIPIKEHEGEQNVKDRLKQRVCELHEQKVLDVYCANCKTVVCAICFIDNHKNHKGNHVNTLFDGFWKQIKSKTDAISECISQIQMKKTKLLKAKEELQQRVKTLECGVAKRKDEVKQLTDDHTNSLLEGLYAIIQSKYKEIQLATDDVDAYLSSLEIYNSYCQKLMVKGSADDICSEVSDLSVRAEELQQQCQPITEREIQSFNFYLRKSELEEFLEAGCGNMIGEIEECDSKQNRKSKQSRISDLANNSLKASNDKLKQELDAEKMTNNSHQSNNDKLKQALVAEKMTNNSLKADNDKLLQEVARLKTTVKTMETNDEKLLQKLKTVTTDSAEKILVLEQKQEQQRKIWIEEKEDLSKQIAELRDKLNPVLVHAVRTKASEEGYKMICGLAILDKELFVATQGSSKVEVYDSTKFSLSRRWNAEGLLRPVDIVSCNKNKCLYVFDCKRDAIRWNEILRVDPDGKLIKKWSTGYDYGYNLSVTNESNVILTVYKKNKLNEYSPDGKLIREIKLSSDAGNRYLLHALKMTNGHFVVSHGGDPPMVSVTDGDGKGKKLWGKPGSTTGQLDPSVHLALGGKAYVIIADQRNSRVLILDSELENEREILSKDTHGIRQPVRILLDEPNGRLFVADNEMDNQRILIFDFKLV